MHVKYSTYFFKEPTFNVLFPVLLLLLAQTEGSFEITDLHPTLLANGKIVDFEGIMVRKGTRPCSGMHEFVKDVRKKKRRHVHS